MKHVCNSNLPGDSTKAFLLQKKVSNDKIREMSKVNRLKFQQESKECMHTFGFDENRSLSPLEMELNKNMFEEFRIVGCLNREYICLIIKNGQREIFCLADQHACHERLRYEYLLKGI